MAGRLAAGSRSAPSHPPTPTPTLPSPRAHARPLVIPGVDGKVEDATCDIQAVEVANAQQLHTVLEALMNTRCVQRPARPRP